MNMREKPIAQDSAAALLQKPIKNAAAGMLLEKAKRARIENPETAPRLLLEALQHRILAIEPDFADPLLAVNHIAKVRGDLVIEAEYGSAVAFEERCRDGRSYDSADWEFELEGVEILLRILDMQSD